MNVVQDKNYTFLASFGSRRAGKTVQYRILYHDGTEKSTWAATGVVELGNGYYGVRTSIDEEMTGYIEWKVVEDSIYAIDNLVCQEDWITKISTVHKVETGRWRIINNQMIFYDTNGSTPILTFNLKDSNSQPASTNVTERIPI